MTVRDKVRKLELFNPNDASDWISLQFAQFF